MRDQRFLEFTRRLIVIFHSNPVLRRRSFFTGSPLGGRLKDLAWIRPDGEEMTDEDWSDPSNHVLGMLIHGRATNEVDERGRPILGDTLLVLLNGGARSLPFALPEVEATGVWEEAVNTARPDGARIVRADTIALSPHSLILLRFAESPAVR